MIAGRNPVLEALRADRPINKLLLAKGVKSGFVKEIYKLAREKNIPVQRVERIFLDKLLGGVAHQGVAALTAGKGYMSLEDILASTGKEDPFLILLNEITDPRNLGAIIRTAEAAGAHGVVIPWRRSVSLTPAAIKTASGAAELLKIARVKNMVQTIRYLQQKNIWVIGADINAKEIFWDARMDGPVALVIGGEKKGLGSSVRNACDFLVRIPMTGQINSLNASVAAALLAYEVLRQRRKPRSWKNT